MGCTHLRALAGAESIRVAAVVDPSPAARSRAESVSPGVRTHVDLAGAVAAGGIDAVLIAAPSNLHGDLVAACAELRLPILCEKPCGTTTAEIAAAGAACRDAGVLLQIGYWRRFVPELIELRQRILSGALGEIALVSCWQWDAEPASPEFRRASGGITVDMGVHEFDQIRWLTGQEIGGLTPATSPVSSVEPVPGDVESFAMLGELSAGAVAFVSLGRHFALGDHVWAEVIGTLGYERVEVLWGDRGDAVFLAALRAQAEDFARSVRRGEIGVGATNDDAFRALETAERAQRQLG
jgi:myo-inositol 2-dehydrogenase/D-chiro-inositol 1-dehydrogenase